MLTSLPLLLFVEVCEVIYECLPEDESSLSQKLVESIRHVPMRQRLSRQQVVDCVDSDYFTGPGNNTCTWLQECCRLVEAEVVSNSRMQPHQTTYKYYFRAQYMR